MSYSKQKEIYAVNMFKAVMLPSIDYIKSIDGYYTGYLFKNNAVSEVHILKDSKVYYFSFIGEYDEEFINSFMNSVIFL